MYALLLGVLIAMGCAPKRSPGAAAREVALSGGELPDAPMAGEHVCPDDTDPLEEKQGENILRSCVVPGREYRNTPYRQGPYTLVGTNGRVRMSGQWKDNQQDGVWRHWHANGKLAHETVYENGVPRSDANWDEAGRPVSRRDASGSTDWYPNGNKQFERRVESDGSLTTTTWHENGQKRDEASSRGGRLVGWKGWSSNGGELTGATCTEDADCAVGVKSECYRCVPPYEPITRWEEAQRALKPPSPPQGCDPSPYDCAALGSPPSVRCDKSRCVVVAR